MNRFASPHGGNAHLAAIGFFLLIAATTLAPLHTKIFGASWLFLCIWCFRQGWGAQRTPSDDVLAAARDWMVCCIVALLLGMICLLVWSENSGILNPHFRAVIPAVAVWMLLRKRMPTVQWRIWIANTLALGSLVAFLLPLALMLQGMDVRSNLASNAIPWAAAMSFFPCLLLPLALNEHGSPALRRFWLIATLCGLLAVLFSQTRGALLVVPWCGLVYAWFWHHRAPRRFSFPATLTLLGCAIAILLAAAWYSPRDPLRLQATANEITEIRAARDYNTSIGARLYIWEVAIDGIRQSPWTGIGSIERRYRIEHAGENGPPEELAKYTVVRSVGHVHNQYLNAALDGGLIGLAALLTFLVGMALAIRRLRRADTMAAWQLGGVLFMHATTSFTNVNFLHNYYVMALTMAAVVPFLCARRTSY